DMIMPYCKNWGVLVCPSGHGLVTCGETKNATESGQNGVLNSYATCSIDPCVGSYGGQKAYAAVVEPADTIWLAEGAGSDAELLAEVGAVSEVGNPGRLSSGRLPQMRPPHGRLELRVRRWAREVADACDAGAVELQEGWVVRRLPGSGPGQVATREAGERAAA